MIERTYQETAYRFLQCLLCQNWDGFDGLFSPECQDYTPQPGQEAGIEGIRSSMKTITDAFPDLRLVSQKMVICGNKVALWMVAEGTQCGKYYGLAPTGNSIALKESCVAEINDGKITGLWHYERLCRVCERGV